MNLTEFNKDRIAQSFGRWDVDAEYNQPIYRYLVYGFNPGSFFTSVLANDFIMAVERSHPANTIPALKRLVGWIANEMPREAWGSYEAVSAWSKKSAEERRTILENARVILTEKEEVWLTLSH